MQQKRIAQPVVEIRNLHFSYGDLQVLRGLSLSIPRGEVVAILGGSGSGKSTLLKLIGGQLRPEQGTVRVEGKNVHEQAVKRTVEPVWKNKNKCKTENQYQIKPNEDEK